MKSSVQRTERINIRVDPRQLEIIRTSAEKVGLGITDYLLLCVQTYENIYNFHNEPVKLLPDSSRKKMEDHLSKRLNGCLLSPGDPRRTAG